jgi:CRISPR-associated protein Cmr4
LLIGNNDLVLEEFDFQRGGDADTVANRIATFVAADENTRESIKKRLVILNDDDFTHFAQYATEVLARIGLDYEKKTVKDGALFYEEFLPPETIFYSVVIASESRFATVKKDAAGILEYLGNNLPEYLQIGADETIGKGICAVRLVNGQEA